MITGLLYVARSQPVTMICFALVMLAMIGAAVYGWKAGRTV